MSQFQKVLDELPCPSLSTPALAGDGRLDHSVVSDASDYGVLLGRLAELGLEGRILQ